MSARESARQEWRGRPERSNALVMRFIVWVALRIGRNAARALLYPICLYFLLFSPPATAASKKYLTRAFGRRPRVAEQFRHYFTFAATILDRVFFLNDQNERFDVKLHAEPEVLELLAGNQGVVLLGAHLGSFEVIRTLGRANAKRRVNMVMYEENARKLNSVLKAINPARSDDIIGLGHCDSMLKVEACLEAGELVGLLADRALSGEKLVHRTFLGEPAGFPLGPFRIAAMLKSPIVLMYGLYRGGACYEIHFERLIDLSDAPRSARNELVDGAVTRYVERLEHYCQIAPFNWFNFYDFWK